MQTIAMTNGTIVPKKHSLDDLKGLAAQKGYTITKVDIWYYVFDENMEGKGKFSKHDLISFLDGNQPIEVEPGIPVLLTGMSRQERDLITLEMMQGAANVSA